MSLSIKFNILRQSDNGSGVIKKGSFFLIYTMCHMSTALGKRLASGEESGGDFSSNPVVTGPCFHFRVERGPSLIEHPDT